jgi:hypothetical protein
MGCNLLDIAAAPRWLNTVLVGWKRCWYEGCQIGGKNPAQLKRLQDRRPLSVSSRQAQKLDQSREACHLFACLQCAQRVLSDANALRKDDLR